MTIEGISSILANTIGADDRTSHRTAVCRNGTATRDEGHVASKKDQDRYRHFQEAILTSLPRDLAADLLEAWTGNKTELKRALRTLLSNPPEDTTIRLGGRIYRFHRVIGPDERVKGMALLERAALAHAMLGQEDAERFLVHAAEIPISLAQKVEFVFLQWTNGEDGFRNIRYIGHDGKKWRTGQRNAEYLFDALFCPVERLQ